MTKKRFSLILISLLLVLSLVACETSNGDNIPDTDETEVDGNDTNTGDNDNQNDNDNDSDNTVNDEKIIAKLYFANDEYLETGDIKLERFGVEERELTNDDNIVKSVYEELLKGPEDSDKLSTVLDKDFILLNSYIKDDTAYLDFKGDTLVGGSLEESFFIDQIVGSLVGLDNITKVQFLIDGEASGSLMGHFSIDEPFTEVSQVLE